MVFGGATMQMERNVRPAVTILTIKALAEEQTLPRLTGMVAQLGMIPEALTCTRSGDFLSINIQLAGADPARLELLRARLAALVVVQRVHQVGS